MARPKKIIGAHKVVVYLGSQTHEMARTLGHGNVSEGIRQAVVAAYNLTEKARISKAIASGADILEVVGARRASGKKL